MAKFLIGVVTGVVLVIVFVVITVFAVVPGREKPPTIAAGSTLMLQLDGEMPERAPVELPIPFLQQRESMTVENVWSILRVAAADSRIKAIVLEPRNLAMGWAKLQEVRGDLEQFKKSGKLLYAYLKTPGTREYYLATAANRVYMAPEDELNMKGMRFELTYFRNTLDKLGVQVEIEHAGKYKDFGDMFTRSSMSPETREVLNSVMDGLFGHLVDTIAAGRNKTPEQIRATIDEGPFMSTQALAAGLVDGLKYEDEFYAELKDKLHSGDLKKVSAREYVRVPEKLVGLGGTQRIALVTGEGGITRDGETSGFSTDDGFNSEDFDKLLRRVADDNAIKGVIVRVDSPGGEVFASDAILREMTLLGKKKPLVISMSDTAASGGYYVAITGDPIIAYPGTITGSIGVVFGKANLKGLYDKVGLTKDFLSRGRFATIDSDYEPLSPAGRQKLREGIDANYKSFVTKVAQARRRKFEEIEPLAQGRVWLGSQAKERGLVDELGGLDRAIELVKEKAKIPRSEKVTLVAYPPRKSIFDVLFGRPAEGLAESQISKFLKSWQARLWMCGGLMRVMPFSLEIH